MMNRAVWDAVIEVRPGACLELEGHAGAFVHVLARAPDEDVHLAMATGALVARGIESVTVADIVHVPQDAADATGVDRLAAEVGPGCPAAFGMFGAWGH